MTRIATTALATLLVGLAWSVPPPAHAGCGCEKAPPDAAEIRPNATYAGSPVTLFHPALQAGARYTVEFASGTTPTSVTVRSVTAVNRRDLADGVYKPQLVVPLPDLPLGPTRVTVRDRDTTVLAIDDAALTVVPAAVTFPSNGSDRIVGGFRAAVGRDGTVYFSLNLSNIHQPRVFRAQALGYPLRFTSADVVFYNTQGFLMQLLDTTMPGLHSIESADGTRDSDILSYSRHEFNTYYLRHDEQQPHATDPGDTDWHLDGTPHIDHRHLIVAIAGVLEGGGTPSSGATPPFDLALSTYSIFEHGLVGLAGVELDNTALTASYDSATGTRSHSGDVLSNGPVILHGNTVIDGAATAAAFHLERKTKITGGATVASEPKQFLLVDMPDFLEDLGDFAVSGHQRVRLGPGSYRATDFLVTGQGEVFVDNATGPVTVYVTGAVHIDTLAAVTVADPDPEKFALYVVNDGPVTLMGQADFFGVVYAPRAPILLSNVGQFYGAFVANELRMTDRTRVFYDLSLRGAAAANNTSDTPVSPACTRNKKKQCR